MTREGKALPSAVSAESLWRVLVDALEPAADSELIDRADWVQLRTPSSRFTTLNKILRARLEQSEADARIAAVIAEHRQRGAALRWVVDENSRPRDLVARLQAQAFNAPIETWGMYRRLSGMAIECPAELAVREATIADAELIAQLGMRGWKQDPTFGESLRDVVERTYGRDDVVYSIASWEGQPVGWSTLRLLEEATYFQGACVVPEARGQGVYRALVARRFDLMRERGYEHAVIWADARSSGPIAASLGFERVASALFCEWYPG